MRKIAIGLLSALAFAGVLATAPAAQATTIASCQYRVTAERISVWESPISSYGHLKYKYRGDVVGGYCDYTVYNSAENRVYLAVATVSAADGVGWVNRALVVKL
jgi:hypothetical protein